MTYYYNIIKLFYLIANIYINKQLRKHINFYVVMFTNRLLGLFVQGFGGYWLSSGQNLWGRHEHRLCLVT